MAAKDNGSCVTALAALVAYGKQDAALHSNPQCSLYDKLHKPVTRSTFTYCTMPCDENYAFDLSLPPSRYGCDMIGECYLHIKDFDANPHPIECVTFECKEKEKEKGDKDSNWQVLEGLDKYALEMHAAMKPCNKIRRHNQNGTVVPLPFFFTNGMSDYFPLVDKMLFRITVKTRHPCEKLELTFKAIYLDTSERREKLSDSGLHSKLYTFSKTQEARVHGPVGTIMLKFNLVVRDLQIIVFKDDDVVQVPEICLEFNGHPHCKLNSMMTTDIIPSCHYGIKSSNSGTIHYIPFCQDPLGSAFTSGANFSMMHFSDLSLKGLESGQSYRVVVMARYWNTMTFQQGKCQTVYA